MFYDIKPFDIMSLTQDDLYNKQNPESLRDLQFHIPQLRYAIEELFTQS